MSWTKAAERVGKQAAIEGPVVTTDYARSASGAPTFLNVGRAYPDPQRFIILIWSENRAAFDGPPEVVYAHHTICATGTVSSYKGVPEIVVRSPAQLKIEDAAATATPSPNPTNLPMVSRSAVQGMPVVACSTGFGAGTDQLPATPAQLPLVPERHRNSLAWYSNGYLTLAAPRGWHCSALVAADGGVALAAAPVSVITRAGKVPQHAAEAVTIYEPSPGTGWVQTVACPFFASARTGANAKCAQPRASESLYRATGHMVYFEDPAWIPGDGYPSGGSSPANGAVIYLAPAGANDKAWIQTCTLPQTQHAVCTAILNAFIAQHPAAKWPISVPTQPPPSPGVFGNPWGYSFVPGTLIYQPPGSFCSYFPCIASFLDGRGFVVQCGDGSFSKSGGIQGACSWHGGEWRPLYSH